MATAWAGAPLPDRLRGVTISLSTEFVDVAPAEDLVADGRVVRRRRSLTAVEVDIRGADGRMVAKAMGPAGPRASSSTSSRSCGLHTQVMSSAELTAWSGSTGSAPTR